jgi:hypothetical protein
LDDCAVRIQNDHLTGSVVAEIDASVEHDGCCGERVGVFEVDSLWCGITVDEEDNACRTGQYGDEIARYVLVRYLDGPVVGCV